MTRKQSAMPSSEMQHRARKLAEQASKLAEQAGPVTRQAAKTAQEGARQSAGQAAEWARPHIGRARVWMAARAANGSVSVQETVAPKVSSMLATTARRLDPPPQPKARRWPRIMLRAALLAASGAVIAAVLRARSHSMPYPSPSQPPTGGTTQPAPVPDQAGKSDRPMAESEFNGMSRTR